MRIKLLVGLGNPGDKYRTTRHNAGWIALDQLCESNDFTQFLYQKKFDAEVANGSLGKRQVIAIKPQSYMNKSGGPLQKVMDFYKVDQSDILILQDEIDLPFGQIKLKYNGSAAGHNGIRDVIRILGNQEIWRLRLGVGRPDHPEHAVTDYVLGNMTDDELQYWALHEREIEEKVMEYMRNTG